MQFSSHKVVVGTLWCILISFNSAYASYFNNVQLQNYQKLNEDSFLYTWHYKFCISSEEGFQKLQHTALLYKDDDLLYNINLNRSTYNRLRLYRFKNGERLLFSNFSANFDIDSLFSGKYNAYFNLYNQENNITFNCILSITWDLEIKLAIPLKWNLTIGVNLTVKKIITQSENSAPQIVYKDPNESFLEIDENQNQTFSIVAEDKDRDPLETKWYVNRKLEQENDNFTFCTDYNSSGNYSIKVNVSDGDKTAQNIWQLEVNNVNRPPVIENYNPKSNISIDENQKQIFSIEKLDPDGDSLEVKWYVFDQLVAYDVDAIEFKTNYSSAGNYEIKVEITDGKSTATNIWYLEVKNVIDYTEIEIEDHIGWAVGDGIKVGQIVDIGKECYLYNVTVHVQKICGDFEVEGNLTLELRGVDIVKLPTEQIYYTITLTDISEGWINIPIGGYYLDSPIYVITYIENSRSPSYYSLSCNGTEGIDATTSIDTGDGFYGVDWDQVMNVTVEWPETHHDENSTNEDISSTYVVTSLFGILGGSAGLYKQKK